MGAHHYGLPHAYAKGGRGAYASAAPMYASVVEGRGGAQGWAGWGGNYGAGSMGMTPGCQ